MTKREQMLECIDEIETRQTLLEGHDIWQDQLVWWMAKAICLLLREAAIADRDELRAPSKPEVNSSGRADAQRGAGRWTPVSERLPEEDTDVLISYRYKEGEGDTSHVYIEITSYGDMYFGGRKVKGAKHWRQPFEYFTSNYEVIAWMPLPEPWKGEEKDGHKN